MCAHALEHTPLSPRAAPAPAPCSRCARVRATYRSHHRSDPCPSLKPDTHDESGKKYEENGKEYVVPKVVFSPEWLIESPPPAHTWEEVRRHGRSP